MLFPIHISWKNSNSHMAILWGIKICIMYALSQKEADHYYFYDNFGKLRQFSKKISQLKFRKDQQRKLELKLPPLLKSVATLPCSFIAQPVQFKVMQRRLIAVIVSQWMLFLCFCLHRLIYHMCLKCLSSAHMHVLSCARHWSMDQTRLMLVERPIQLLVVHSTVAQL